MMSVHDRLVLVPHRIRNGEQILLVAGIVIVPACFFSTSATAERIRAASAAASTGTPSSRAYII
jgi:hypothetical protein